MEPIDDYQAEKIVRDYVCSNCWGHLVVYPAGRGESRVECHNCGEHTVGYVTKFYVNRRLSESIGERLDVQINLRDVPGMDEHRGKSNEQLLEELGY